MFYFYGRKYRISNLYPKPIYNTIIEPFSGSAAYSMLHYDKNVILNDKDDKIYKLWKYLIDAEKDEIDKLPILEKGESLNDEKFNYLTDEQKYLIGFYLNPGSAVPKKSPAKYNSWNDKNKKIIIDNLDKIRHWKIYNKDYRELENIEATWFIDPPYQGNGGKYYRLGNKNIDYDELREWVYSRKGQIIVCENSESNWLDFKPLVKMNGQKRKTTEVIWTNQGG
jgi:site-specific DNA-adenine methylase